MVSATDNMESYVKCCKFTISLGHVVPSTLAGGHQVDSKNLQSNHMYNIVHVYIYSVIFYNLGCNLFFYSPNIFESRSAFVIIPTSESCKHHKVCINLMMTFLLDYVSEI